MKTIGCKCQVLISAPQNRSEEKEMEQNAKQHQRLRFEEKVHIILGNAEVNKAG